MPVPLPRFLTAFLPVLLLIQGCTAQSRLVAGSQETAVRETLQYYLYYPPGYDESEEEFGILLFLHGGGEAGQSLEAMRENGPPKMLLEGNDFPFLILAPYNSHKKQWWNVRAVRQLLDSVVADNRVDRNRIYLTGLSRGGSASWEMAVQYPDTFAALVVVCGMAPLPYASWIDPDLPIRVFHGTEDEVIPFSESERMVARLQQIGYDVELTAYEGVGHNSWDRAYRTEGLFEWIAAQSRSDR
ncbi:PHB depolymerase family esterase [Robiginitalea sp. SC105]|uniref:carboxylesterase family protein n=1 Tax=Robiginitalea sp. SC105 TaxID=2762332 RepID=UPI00163AA1BC|nr:PHB depolymerase family esterase [Robiginitalea sp. SC105]MBC2840282.1 prolyl oligopeptidase family serine peptidase [Robiginitalea sp. SC105]